MGERPGPGILDPTMLLRLVEAHQSDAARFVTRHFALSEIIEAYDTFGRPADTGAIKVVMTR
jgi:alcohol dehydrogenase